MKSQLQEAGSPHSGDEPSGAVTRLLWYEVEELPGPVLRVRRVARPADALFFRLCLALWFGFACLVAPTFLPWPMVLLVLAAGSFVFYGALYTLGLGAEEWRVAPDRFVVRRQFFARAWEHWFTGAALQITESQVRGTRAFFLGVREPTGVVYLLSLNNPTPEQSRRVHALGERLARVTGWHLVTAP